MAPEKPDHDHEGNPWYLDVAMSALLRAAWRAYGDVVRAAVADAGMDDLPRNGAYVLGATARGSLPLQQMPGALGITKQAFSQLLDALVTRGYARREPDPADRRRLVLALTPRGQDAADLVAECAVRCDRALLAQVGDADVATTRRVLAVMTGIRETVEP